MIQRATVPLVVGATLMAAIYQAVTIAPRSITLRPPPLVATDQVIDAFSQQHADMRSRDTAIAAALISGRRSLVEEVTLPSLNFILSGERLVYSTNAEYFTALPKCEGEIADIRIASASAFGLRGYIFDENCVAFEAGHESSAYYAAAVDDEAGLIAFSIPGQSAIDIYSIDDMALVNGIRGYSATALAFVDGHLFFSGTEFGADWEAASVYEFSVAPTKLETTYLRGRLSDSRGIAFGDRFIAISNGAKNQVLITDHRFRLIKSYDGMSYPNGVSFTGDGTLLVSDEHNGHVIEIDLDSDEIVWSSPAGELLSPGSAVEIKSGTHAGRLLISDTDGARVIIVDRNPWNVVFEAGPVRSVMSSAPIYQ